MSMALEGWLQISSDTAPNRAPLWIPFSEIDGVDGLFDEATHACKLNCVEEMLVILGWPGKRLLLRDREF